MPRSSFTQKEKLKILNLITEDHYAIHELTSIYKVDWATIRSWQYKYETYEELSKASEDYIHFYYYERYQKRLNGLSPMECRAKAA